MAELVSLGRTEVRITRLGTGAWAWGDRLMWGFGQGYDAADAQAAFEASLEAGINWFDTAEAYGQGRSERLLGQFMRANPARPALAATKFLPLPWRLGRGSLLSALHRSLERLGLPRVDLYQVHFHLPPISVEARAEALADAVQAGLARAVGVSNYSAGQMRRANDTLDRRGVPLASNQVEYSLLNRSVELNGVQRACRELNVTLIAYSPIAKGILTGKYTPENPPPGARSRIYSPARLRAVQPLIGLLREIGQAYGGKTPSQVSLNWLICKGAVPIPGAKNARQAQENAGALGWQLNQAELAALDEASQKL